MTHTFIVMNQLSFLPTKLKYTKIQKVRKQNFKTRIMTIKAILLFTILKRASYGIDKNNASKFQIYGTLQELKYFVWNVNFSSIKTTSGH